MELPCITEPLSTPDIFWASGDGVFQKLLPSTYRQLSQHEKAMFRMTDIRGNLNFHLLTHRRLVIVDTSLLLSPTLMTLFEEKPAYSDFLSQGIIVPLMREGVTSFQDLVKVLRKGKNWVEPPDHDVDRWAKFLDNVRPKIADARTPLNRELMDSIGDEKLLRAEFWEAIGLGKSRNELVKYVPSAMKKKQQKNIRQTEFWEFAARLAKKAPRQANMIRTRLSIISIGVMAKTLGLPLSYPSAYSNQLDETYGTNSPYHCNKDLVSTDEPALQEEIENTRQHFYSGVYYLTPDVIWDIRERAAYKTLMKELVRYDNSDADTTNDDLFSAWKAYHQNYSTTVGLKCAGTLEEYSNLKMIIRWLVPGGIAVSATMGILCSYVLKLPIFRPELLTTATTIATIYLTKKIGKKKNELERKAQIEFAREIPQLQREDGQFVSELYGPIEEKYWQM